MSHSVTLGLPDAARHLGVSVRVLRQAIRLGRIPAPPHLTATSPLPADWLTTAESAIEADPKALSGTSPQDIPAFARYEGTSAWRKYRRRVREYAKFHATGG